VFGDRRQSEDNSTSQGRGNQLDRAQAGPGQGEIAALVQEQGAAGRFNLNSTTA